MKTLAVMLLCAPLIAHADDKSDAQALFDRGIAEMKESKLDEACKHLAASLAKLPDSGTRGALAVCTTKLGKIATAWTLWKELAVTAPTDAMKASAAQAAAELEPRLPKYQISKKPGIAGLTVTINGTQVDLSIDVPLPVDPGKVAIVATAPSYQTWTGEATASEQLTTQIEIPDLKPAPAPPKLGIEHREITAHGSHDPKPNWTARGLLIGGGVSLVAGVIFGLRASSLWHDAEDACGDVDACPGNVFDDASDKYSAARTSAIVSTIFVGAGAAALIGGGVLWYVTRDHAHSEHAVIPTVSADGAGVAFIGSWR